MKMKKIGPGGRPKFYYVDPPLTAVPFKINSERLKKSVFGKALEINVICRTVLVTLVCSKNIAAADTLRADNPPFPQQNVGN